MADWYGSARSNYFLVRDRQAFEAALKPLEIKVVEHTEWKANGQHVIDGRLALLSEDEYGGWPSSYFDEQADDDVEVDLLALIAEHLVDGEVAVLMEVGAEKLRYLTGHAFAVNSKGEQRHIGIDDIYKQAAELGTTVTEALY